jgi:hypothetical protein
MGAAGGNEATEHSSSPGGVGMADVAKGEGSAPLTRALAWLVLALMAAATVYSGWIALANFNRIGV